MKNLKISYADISKKFKPSEQFTLTNTIHQKHNLYPTVLYKLVSFALSFLSHG